MRRSAVERAIAAELTRHGANRVAVAGIIGNAYRESSLNPTAEGTGGGGLWGFTSGAISLANLKKAGGSNWGDPTFQTDFMLAHGGQGLIPQLNRAKTPGEAARLFMEQWEKPGIPALSVREAGARSAYRRLRGFNPASVSAPSPPESGGSSAPGGLQGDLMHAGLVGALVLGGAGMVGLGVTRFFGTAQKRRAAS